MRTAIRLTLVLWALLAGGHLSWSQPLWVHERPRLMTVTHLNRIQERIQSGPYSRSGDAYPGSRAQGQACWDQARALDRTSPEAYRSLTGSAEGMGQGLWFWSGRVGAGSDLSGPLDGSRSLAGVALYAYAAADDTLRSRVADALLHQIRQPGVAPGRVVVDRGQVGALSVWLTHLLQVYDLTWRLYRQSERGELEAFFVAHGQGLLDRWGDKQAVEDETQARVHTYVGLCGLVWDRGEWLSRSVGYARQWLGGCPDQGAWRGGGLGADDQARLSQALTMAHVLWLGGDSTLYGYGADQCGPEGTKGTGGLGTLERIILLLAEGVVREGGYRPRGWPLEAGPGGRVEEGWREALQLAHGRPYLRDRISSLALASLTQTDYRLSSGQWVPLPTGAKTEAETELIPLVGIALCYGPDPEGWGRSHPWHGGHRDRCPPPDLSRVHVTESSQGHLGLELELRPGAGPYPYLRDSLMVVHYRWLSARSDEGAAWHRQRMPSVQERPWVRGWVGEDPDGRWYKGGRPGGRVLVEVTPPPPGTPLLELSLQAVCGPSSLVDGRAEGPVGDPVRVLLTSPAQGGNQAVIEPGQAFYVRSERASRLIISERHKDIGLPKPYTFMRRGTDEVQQTQSFDYAFGIRGEVSFGLEFWRGAVAQYRDTDPDEIDDMIVTPRDHIPMCKDDRITRPVWNRWMFITRHSPPTRRDTVEISFGRPGPNFPISDTMEQQLSFTNFPGSFPRGTRVWMIDREVLRRRGIDRDSVQQLTSVWTHMGGMPRDTGGDLSYRFRYFTPHTVYGRIALVFAFNQTLPLSTEPRPPAPARALTLRLVPNPAPGGGQAVARLSAPCPAGGGRLKVYSPSGVGLWEGRWPAGQRELPVPTGGWPRGLYLVRLHLPEGHSQVVRLVVE